MPDLVIAQAAAAKNVGPPPEFIAFGVIWVLLALANYSFFQFNRNAALKRRLWPIFIILTGALFAAFIYHTTPPNSPVMFIFGPAIAVITLINIRTTRFCDSCGKTLFRQPFFSKDKFCPSCGAKVSSDL